MSDDRAPEAEAETPQGGVFGNLPGSRPGKRSPRRDSADAGPKRAAPTQSTARTAKAKAKAKATPRAEATPVAPSRAAKPPPAAAERSHAPAAEAEGGNGLEDIAWAGVAAAAEAATLGVRLASRAIEALRGNSERS
jgi:hypothetical protein